MSSLPHLSSPMVAVLGQDPNLRFTELPFWLPLVAIAVLFYFLLIRPESRKRKEHDRMLEHLKQDDRVVTIGGIHGKVVSVNKETQTVILRVDDNTKMRFSRSAIARMEADEKGEGK